MKALLISLVALLTLAACNPRDPEVLSRDDKEAAQNRGNSKDKEGASCDPKLPKRMELAMGALAEGRISQARQILNLSLKLSEQKEAVVTENCIESTLLETSGNQKRFRISYQRCSLKKGDVTATMSGVAEMIVRYGKSQEVDEVEFNSHPLNQESAEALIIQLKTKGTKDKLYLADQINLNLKKENGAYKITGQSYSALEIGFEASRSSAEVSVYTEGEITPDASKSWHAEVRGVAEKLNDKCSKPPSTFELILDPVAEASQTYKYQMGLWGEVSREGQLTFGDQQIESKTKNEKTKKDETASTKKNAIETATDLLPWEMWL